MSLPRREGREPHLVEFMDRPDCDPTRLTRTYRAFGVVNLLLGRWGALVRQHFVPLLEAHAASGSSEPFRILDVGAGGGDVLRRIRTLTQQAGVPIELVGVDPDPRAVVVAKALTPSHPTPIRWVNASAESLLAAGERFHLVISNHVLHHLLDPEIVPFLRTLEALALHRVVVTDIERSQLGYVAFGIASRLLFPGTLIHADGLLSIRRSFRAAELSPHLPPGWQVSTLRPYRLVLTFDPS
jgi:2-polyprenyl-3-methyl-5-hydroxy-6-metoxy-1,4-benzoquinol methylase